MKKNGGVLALQTMLAVLVANISHARTISPGEVQTAAETWLRTSGIAQSVLAGRKIGAVERRGGIWLMRLNPLGYVIMSSSDLAAPIIAFSDKVFKEPERGSAFYDVFHGAASGHARLLDEESSSQVSTGGVRRIRSARTSDIRAAHRKSRWEALLDEAKANRVPKLAQRVESTPSGVVVTPFLSTLWNQWLPWNDFAPVYDPTGSDPYRGRCPCGCTVTAAAQTLAYWKWPVYSDCGGLLTGTFMASDGICREYPMRFVGDVPLRWDGLPEGDIGGPNFNRWRDLRGVVPESVRYPMARLTFFCNWLAEMDFKPDGSSADFRTVASHAPWYQRSRWVNPRTDYEGAVSAMKADLVDRVPVQVTVNCPEGTHAVVGCGWAEDAGDHFVYLNFGWSGSDDGYYNMDDRWSDTHVQEACVGFKPRKTVQLDPLPKVVDDVRLSWHLPEAYAQEERGFDILTRELEFAKSARLSFVGPDQGVFTSGTKTVCDISGDFIPTKDSVISFDVASSNMLNNTISLQLLRDGEWLTIWHSRVNWFNSQTSPMHAACWIGGFSGRAIRLRLKSDCDGGFYSDGRAVIGGLELTNVLRPGAASSSRVSKGTRKHVCTGLQPGKTYSIAVRPVMSGSEESAARIATRAGAGLWPKAPALLPELADFEMADEENSAFWSCVASSRFADGLVACPWDGGFAVCLPGWLTDETMLSFDLESNSYMGSSDCREQVEAYFVDKHGSKTVLWSTNSTVNLVRHCVAVRLGKLAGEAGTVCVYYRHEGGQNAPGATFRNVKLSHVRLADLRNDPESDLSTDRWQPRNSVLAAPPEILEITGPDGLPMDEGFYRDLPLAGGDLFVSCSETVVSLKAYSSHLQCLDDGRVKVSSLGGGHYWVHLQPAADMPRRQRLVLTLAAENANGDVVWKDLSLRFDTEENVKLVDDARPLASLGYVPKLAFAFDGDCTGTGLEACTLYWNEYGYCAARMGQALEQTSGDGPYNGLTLGLTGDWSILAVARSSTVDNGVIFSFGTTYPSDSAYGFALASGGGDTVTLSCWTPDRVHTDIVAAKVANAATAFHVYGIRRTGKSVELWVDGTCRGTGVLSRNPILGLQAFGLYYGGQWTGLRVGEGAAADDLRLYDMAVSDTAIIRYDELVRRTDPATSYTIRFHANGALGSMHEITHISGRVHRLPFCTFVPDSGRRFAGWRCSKTGKRYDDGMLVFNLAEPGETVTMTAIWEGM